MTQDPQHAVALLRAGRLAEAEQAFRALLGTTPGQASLHYHLGAVLHRLGRLAEAADSLGRAERLDPAQAAYPYLLASVLHDLGDLEGAVAGYRRAIRRNPGLYQAHNNLAQALQDRGDIDGAIAALHTALGIKPDYPEGWRNLAAAHEARGDWPQAERALRTVLDREPGSARAHHDLALMLKRQDRYAEAVALLERAVALDPWLADAHAQLGLLLAYGGEPERGLACLRHALDLRPDARTHSMLLFLLSYLPGLGGAAIHAEHLAWAARYATPPAGACRPHGNAADPDRRLRIGYVSADFKRHAVAPFLRPILAGHDRDRFEVHCYSDVKREDPLTGWFRGQADAWHPIRGLTDAALAERVRADGIDILVDLAGHSAGNRLLAFARRPAPVQVSYLGYLGSTGMTAMDYRLTDAVEAPAGSAEALHSETLIRLPHGMWCFSPPEEAPAVSPLPALAAGHVTFASFNNSAKLNGEVIAVWAELLRRLPDARMLLVARGDPALHARLLDRFASHGIARDRIALRATQGFADYLALHAEADMLLDSFPYTGGATTCLALWMGLPVVSLTGDRPFSRSSASLLAMLGRNEWIVDSADAYLRAAQDLAADLPRLAALRAGLRPRMQASPLLDAAGFMRDLEHAYRDLWQHWCQQQRAHSTQETRMECTSVAPAQAGAQNNQPTGSPPARG
jgi:predicted O-linked N-acetylglucosamine transferase (SPINDLY family)